MNTAKQINIMIGLLMVGMLGTLLYYMFDNGDSVLGLSIGDRQTVATDRSQRRAVKPQSKCEREIGQS